MANKRSWNLRRSPLFSRPIILVNGDWKLIEILRSRSVCLDACEIEFFSDLPASECVFRSIGDNYRFTRFYKTVSHFFILFSFKSLNKTQTFHSSASNHGLLLLDYYMIIIYSLRFIIFYVTLLIRFYPSFSSFIIRFRLHSAFYIVARYIFSFSVTFSFFLFSLVLSLLHLARLPRKSRLNRWITVTSDRNHSVPTKRPLSPFAAHKRVSYVTKSCLTRPISSCADSIPLHHWWHADETKIDIDRMLRRVAITGYRPYWLDGSFVTQKQTFSL